MATGEKRVPYPAVLMVLASILSIQVGSAMATNLFDELGVGGTIFMRSLVSAVALTIIWRPNFRIKRADVPVTLIFGAVLAVLNFAFYEAIARVPLGTAVTIEFIGPLSVALITSHRRKDLMGMITPTNIVPDAVAMLAAAAAELSCSPVASVALIWTRSGSRWPSYPVSSGALTSSWASAWARHTREVKGLQLRCAFLRSSRFRSHLVVGLGS